MCSPAAGRSMCCLGGRQAVKQWRCPCRPCRKCSGSHTHVMKQATGTGLLCFSCSTRQPHHVSQTLFLLQHKTTICPGTALRSPRHNSGTEPHCPPHLRAQLVVFILLWLMLSYCCGSCYPVVAHVIQDARCQNPHCNYPPTILPLKNTPHSLT